MGGLRKRLWKPFENADSRRDASPGTADENTAGMIPCYARRSS